MGIKNILVHSRLTHIIIILSIYVIVVAFAIAEKQPWFDEGAYAHPSYNLLNYGHLGMPVLFSQLRAWPSVDYYTFHMPPLSFVLQAGWFWLFDFGVFQMRSLSAVFGAILILSLYFLVLKISNRHVLALLSIGIIGTDYNMITWCADGRMDIICAGLGFASASLFICLREKQFGWALIGSQTLVVASGLTHPTGILYLIGVLLLILIYDWRRIKLTKIILMLVPFVIGGAGWGHYIAQDVGAFQNQFFGNYGGRETRFFSAPLAELNRYLSPAFGIGDQVGRLGQLKIFQLIAYWAAVICFVCIPSLRLHARITPVFILLILFIIMTAVILSSPHLSYLVHVIPLYAVVLAAVLSWGFNQGLSGKIVTITLLGFLIAVQAAGPFVKYFTQNGYAHIYQPAVNIISEFYHPGDIIVGSSEFAFAFGYEGEVIDNHMLGVKGGLEGDIVILGGGYRKLYLDMEYSAPNDLDLIRSLLDRKYETVGRSGEYEIFRKINN